MCDDDDEDLLVRGDRRVSLKGIICIQM